MVTQNHKAEAISFYDYCLTNVNVIILFSLFFSWSAFTGSLHAIYKCRVGQFAVGEFQ